MSSYQLATAQITDGLLEVNRTGGKASGDRTGTGTFSDDTPYDRRGAKRCTGYYRDGKKFGPTPYDFPLVFL